MTPERQRIAIAEACGWQNCTVNNYASGMFLKGAPIGTSPDSERTQYIPDYPNDLNAMHAVEEYWKDKTISKQDPQNPSAMLHGLSFVLQYHRHLALVTGAQNGVVFYPDIQWHASAAQRAEAFLRTIGKWEN